MNKVYSSPYHMIACFKKAVFWLFALSAGGLLLSSFALAGDVNTQNVNSRFGGGDPAQSQHYEYYFSSSNGSHQYQPNDSMYDGYGPDLFFPNGTNVKIWRNGVIEQCNDWGSLSSAVPQSTWTYIFKNNDNCRFTTPNYLKKDKPSGHIDAQIHYDINWGALDSSGPSTRNGRLYYRTSINTIKCYPGGNTVSSPSQCPSGNHKYWSDDNYGGNHDVEVIDYEIFRCGDGLVQNGQSFDNGQTANEVCDPGDDSTCLSDCSGYQVTPVCGGKNGDEIYDFNNNGDALNQNSSGLCPSGTSVNNFQYSTSQHKWTWKCASNGQYSPLCEATELRCGDGDVNSSQEQCDDGDNDDNDECDNSCQPGTVGECGDKDGEYIYDFDNNGNALNQNSQRLCPSGQSVIQFNYANHEWTWKCDGPGGESETCSAREQWCGDGDVNSSQEQCDDGDNDDNDECDNSCQPGTVGECGEKDGDSIYDFDNNGDALNANNQRLCPSGQSVIQFNYANHEWTWKCDGPGGESETCSAREERCGDGDVNDPQERCDDGNDNNNDACTNLCETGAPGECGEKDGDYIYDFDNNGDALNANNQRLCPSGQSVIQFNYANHEWTWKCDGPGGESETCSAREERCGDGDVNDPQERCDDGNDNNNDACTNLCETGAPGECGEKDGDSIYDFDNNGDALNANNQRLCPSGQSAIQFNYANHEWTWKCDGPGGESDICRAREERCGDGDVNDPQERCDDGNDNNNDACTNLCETGEIGICGGKDGEYIYDFDNNGDALNANSQRLCPSGQSAIQFNYANHEWTWKCEGPAGDSDECSAREERCGDGDVNGVDEQCDDGNNIDDDSCNNNCELITTDPVCLDTNVSPQSDVEPGQEYTITCLGQDIDTFTIEVELDGTVIETYEDVVSNDPVTYTIPNDASDTSTFSFQCIPSDPALPPSEWCDKEYRGVVDTAFECIDSSVTPSQTELDETGDSDEFTITCEGIGVDTWKVDVIDQDTNEVITSLMDPVSSSSTQAVFTYDPSVAGNYQFSCRAMTDTAAEDCPIVASVVTEPGVPGECGEKDGDYIYDFDNSGDAIDENNQRLCPDGQAVVQFNYTDHEWTWKCENDGENSPVCRAWEERCGDGEVNDADEQCDDGNLDDNDGCTNTCTQGEPELYIEKSASTTTIVPGETVEYIISFWNEGDSVAEAVKVTDEMPDGFIIEGTPSFDLDAGVQGSPSISIDGNDVTLDGFDLAPGQGGTLTVRARVEQEGCGFCNVAIIDSLNQYAEAAGSHVFCNQEPDLDKKQRNVTVGGNLTDDQILVSNGDTVEYEITFSNDGAEMLDELLVDVLPDEVIFNDDLDVTVNGDADVTCNYDATVHQIICPVDLIAQGAIVTLSFTVEIIEDIPDQNNIVNTVSFAGLADLVIAVGEPKNPNGIIIKNVDNTEGQVGDIFTYTITFVNEGDVDLVEYKIMDYWPAELGLVRFDNVGPISPVSITVDELASPCVQYDGGENCAKLITYMFDTPLSPGESVDIVIEGEGLVESNYVVNTVEVWYKDDHGNEDDGHDDDDETIIITMPAGECAHIDTELAGSSMTTDTLPVVIDVHCVGDGAPADTIEIDCGNGDGTLVSDLPSAVYGCTYNEAGEYFAECFFNGEPVAKDSCVAPISIEVEDEEEDLGICGDGKKNLFESCDLGIGQIDGPVAVGPNGVIFQNQPRIDWTPYVDTLPEDYVCDACQLVYDGGPGGPGGPNPGDYCHLDPETGACLPEEVKCFQQDVTMSVMKNEKLPIRWDIESDVIDVVNSCSGPSDEGKVINDTLWCSFEIQHAGQVVATLPPMKCDTNDWGGAEMFKPFEAILQEGVIIDPGRSFIELSEYVPYNAPLGEYKIKMTSIDFDYCGPNGQILQSHTENCCMANFAITDKYLMQIGTVTSEGAATIYGDVDVQQFEAMDGSPIFDKYGLEYYELIEADDYEGGDAVGILIDTFVQKYDALAVSPGDVGTEATLRKVPGKNIFVADGTVVINESSVFDGPFTLIVTQGELIIEGNVESNGMFVVPNGEIQFSRKGLCDGSVNASNYDDWETIFGRQVVNGIFITQVGFNSVPGEDPVLNNDLNKPRCFGGGLVLRGVAIGDGLENVVATRRSDLYRWFWESNEGKQGLIYGGASLLMEQNPSLWIESPDGLEDLENILRLYRR